MIGTPDFNELRPWPNLVLASFPFEGKIDMDYDIYTIIRMVISDHVAVPTNYFGFTQCYEMIVRIFHQSLLIK